MQEVYKADWFARNEMTKYPLDSQASLLSDSGEPSHLDNLITDMNVSFPSTLGSQIRISALTITDEMLTLVLSTESGDDTISLLAFSESLRNIKPCQYYTLNSLYSGCFGVITFGNAINTVRGVFRFATYAQSGIIPSAQCRYAVFPVLSIAKQGSKTRKVGDVRFKAGEDVSVTRENISPRETRAEGSIGVRQALVFRLDSLDLAAVLKDYCPVCAGRPEANTCKMANIDSISGVFPDCDGNIDVRVEGITARMTQGAMYLNYDKVLADVCSNNDKKLLVGVNECDATEYSTPQTLYTAVLPRGDTGIRYVPSGGVTNATPNTSTEVSVDTISTAMRFKFITTGYFSVQASNTTFSYDQNMATVEGSAVALSTTYPTLFLEIGLSQWVLKTQTETLATWDVSLEALSDIVMTLQGCTCLNIEAL